MISPSWRCLSRLSTSVLLLVCFSNVCLAADYPDCINGPLNNTPVCDTSLDALSRARSLVGMMNITEKINNTINTTPGIPRLGLPNIEWWSEALHGVAVSPGVTFRPMGQNWSYATSFPEPILMGAAFDDQLIYDVASVISTEMRAFSNFGNAGINAYTPNINPFRDPRWGRGMETPGEDPYHTSSYVRSLVTGLQFGGDDPHYQKLAATCKHFAAYDLEAWENYTRYEFDAIVSSQDLVEYYLPPFAACVRDANVSAVMCSYNAVNGVPTCADDYLLQTILRQYWGFEPDLESLSGHYVTSDCDAVSNIYTDHHYTTTPVQAAADALLAGTDLDCGTYYSSYLEEAYDEGLIQESDIDRALIRLFASMTTLGYFDPPAGQIYRQYQWSDVGLPAAQQLAYQAAWEGITLLKNDGTLPIAASNFSSVALIGPWANATTQMQGNYAGIAPFLISPLQALQERGIPVNYVFGANISSNDTSGFAGAVSAAQAASLVIFLGGIDTTVEFEGTDRNSLSWPGNQLDLISELAAVSKPLIVFQMGGGQVDSSSLFDNSKVNAVIWGGYPGQAGGSALIDIMFGTQAPAGRLPLTQYPANYVNEVPMTDMSLRPSADNPGRTYKWYSGTPVVPFGYGLHYTTFSVVSLNSTAASYSLTTLLSNGQALGNAADKAVLDTFSVKVENTGSTASDYVALLFLTGEFGEAPYPSKQLVSYTRLRNITPGSSENANFNLTLGSIARADSNGNLYLYPGTYNLVVDVVNPVTVATFQVTGSSQMLLAFPQPN